MKKAILISAILWIAFSVIGAIIFFVVGAVSTSPEVIQAAVDSGATREAAEAAARTLQATLIYLGVYCIIAIALCVVMLILRNKQIAKGAGIAVGVIGIVTSAVLPGIFFLVDSVKNR